MIAALLAKAGLAPEPAPEAPAISPKAERDAAVAKTVATVQETRIEHDLLAKKANADWHTAQDAIVAKTVADAADVDYKVSIELADKAHTQLRDLFARYRTQPSRALAFEIKQALKDLDAEAKSVMGGPLWHLLPIVAFCAVLVAETPDLAAFFQSPHDLQGVPVNAAHALQHAAQSIHITELEDAMQLIERAIDSLTNRPILPATAEAQRSFEVMQSHACPQKLHAALADLRVEFGAKQAVIMAASPYQRPSNVISGPGEKPSIQYEAPANTAVVQVDFNESNHFSRLAATDVDLSRI